MGSGALGHPGTDVVTVPDTRHGDDCSPTLPITPLSPPCASTEPATLSPTDNFSPKGIRWKPDQLPVADVSPTVIMVLDSDDLDRSPDVIVVYDSDTEVAPLTDPVWDHEAAFALSPLEQGPTPSPSWGFSPMYPPSTGLWASP